MRPTAAITFLKHGLASSAGISVHLNFELQSITATRILLSIVAVAISSEDMEYAVSKLGGRLSDLESFTVKVSAGVLLKPSELCTCSY